MVLGTGDSYTLVIKQKSWIEIELLGEDDKGIAYAKYKIIMPDESVVEGNLDENGFTRLEKLEKAGECKVSFPEIDMDAWELIEAE